ncbi:MAG: DoxX family membrane protein [Maribacter sp.]|nr:DoxX family membrane protein [Maribacter sp.]
MRYLVGVVRIFVGILFIISGFIKLNDPVGFSFKLEEYFSQGVLDLPFLTPFALAISILVVIVEVMVGVMLILGYKRKFTIWTLIAMIVFFTFLTFYSAYFNKVTDCGCFGDAIKLTPWESFTKDVVLLVLILIIYAGRKYITPLVNSKALTTVLATSFLACVGYVYYVLNHLPVIDFRPYEIGKNIEDGMSTPDDAPKAVFEYRWKFNVNGTEEIHISNGDYPTVEGEFIDVETEEIQAGYEPPVHDFTIEQEGEDFASSLLQEPKLVMVIAYDLRKSNLEEFKNIKTLADKAIKAGYKVIGMSASGPDQTDALVIEYNLGFYFYFTDETTLKTIVRANPGVLVLEKGTIKQKVHYNDLEDLIFN